jgi:signal transduction histidine kinase
MALLRVQGQLGRPALRVPGWRLGIRARLFLLALVTLSPLVAVLAFQDYFHLVQARQRADADAGRLALMKAVDVDQHLVAVDTQLAALRAVLTSQVGQSDPTVAIPAGSGPTVAMPAAPASANATTNVTPASVAAGDAAFSAVLSDLPAYVDGIAAFTPLGQPLGAAWRDDLDPAALGGALQDAVEDATTSRRLVVGQPLPPTQARPSAVLAARLLADRAGSEVVMILALRPDRMPLLTDIRGLPRGSTISVVDVRGQLLARSSEPAGGGGLPLTAGGSGGAGLLSARAELERRASSASEDRVIGHAVADRAPWVVYVDAPAEIALVAARTDFYRDLVIGGVMLTLALLLAWLISERITAPIRQLTADATALGAGQLSRRSAVKTDDEIGLLATAFNETAGAIEHLVGSLRNTQAELRALNVHLEQRVRDRTAQLAALNSELEAFSFSVSHDLRAPLRRIDAFSVALIEDYGDRLDDEGRLMLERLSAGCEQMSQLIDDLLRLSRVSRTELNYGQVDLAAIATEIARELRQAHPDHPVTFEVTGRPDQLRVHGDASLLRVVLQNLLANAWKFTRGQAHPRVELGMCVEQPPQTAAGPVEIGHDPANPGEDTGVPAFFIRDNGVGFDPVKADKLFRAFQRLHEAREFEGTGVGLATVQRIVHRHGGRVWANGTVGGGATFWFTVPDWLEGR